MMRRLALLALVCAVMGIAGRAQLAQSRPWFGATLPPGLGDPHRPIIDVSAARPSPAVVPPGDEKNHDLEGPAIRQSLQAIVGISPGRLATGEEASGRLPRLSAAAAPHY